MQVEVKGVEVEVEVGVQFEVKGWKWRLNMKYII